MLKKVNPYELKDNFFEQIGNNWALVTALDQGKVNTMTASWGTVGVLWHEPVFITYIRDQRYTRELIENTKKYTVTFVDGNAYRKELTYLGSTSGRDEDKLAHVGFDYDIAGDFAHIRQGLMHIDCEIIYAGKFEEEKFLDTTYLDKNYQNKDFSNIYVGKIVGVYLKEED